MDGFDLDAYLKRIGAAAGPATLQTLQSLHAAHAGAIPFEGLDPFCGRPVKLDLASLQAKLVQNRRGGYCFEQNALFKAALEALGFQVTGLAGRVRWMSPPDAPLGPREHMLLKVDLPEGAFIADVGFGACVMDAALRLVAGEEQTTGMGSFRLDERDGLFYLSAKQTAGWRTMYAFDLEPQRPSDYELGNYFTSTNPAAPFPNIVIMERVEPGARHKLINNIYIREARDGETLEQRPLQSWQDWQAVLEETFGVTAPAPAQELFARAKAAAG